jgi:hypothetical protein
LARHRRIVNGVRLDWRVAGGRQRHMRDSDFARLILNDISDLGRKRFAKLCVEGYAELRIRLKHTPWNR